MEPTPNALPPEEVQPAATPTKDASTTKAAAVGPSLSSARIWTLVLAAGLIAGFASWLAGEALNGLFESGIGPVPGLPSAEDARKDALARASGEIWTTTTTFGALGAILGLALGLAGGLARRSTRSTLTAALTGTVLGAIAGVAMTRLLLPIYNQSFDPNGDDMVLAIAIQGGIFSVIGAVGGAAFGIGLGGGRGLVLRTLLGGLLGAVAGVLLFQVAGALAFPLDETAKLISASSATRLFCRLSVTLLASLCAATGWSPGKPRTT